MSDEDDPFADLDAMGEQASSETADTTEADETADPVEPTSTVDEVSAADPYDEPGFAFDETTQRPLYAREDTWEAFEDVCDFDAKRLLRDDGLKNVEGREFHDAALRLAAANPEALAEHVRQARGIGEQSDDE
jgi:hypothetical protein